MDNIISYDHDSSDTDEHPLSEIKESSILNPILSLNECYTDQTASKKTGANRSGSDSETQRNKYIIGSNTTDFFNLRDSDSSSSEEDCTKNMVCSRNKSSNVDNKFWDGDDNLDSPSEIWNVPECASHINSNSINMVNISGTTKQNSTIHNHVPRDTSFNQFSSEMKLSKYQSKRAKVSNYDNISEHSQSIKVNFDSSVKIRPIYQIHSKINPLMTDNIRCKTSSKVINNTNGHVGIINKIEWCVPQYSHLLVSASMDKYVKIWDVLSKDSKCARTLLSHNKAVKHVCWSKSGREILSCSYDKSAAISDVETGKVLTRCNHDNFVSVAKYHPVNFNYFVTGTYNKLMCWDSRNTTKPTCNFVYKDTFGQVQDLIFLQDGRELITCNDLVCRDSADRNIMAWDFCKGVVVSNQIYQERYTCTRLQTHPTEALFIAQTQGDYIAQFSAIRPYKLNKFKRYQGHKVVGYNIGCDISADGKFVVSGSSDGQVLFYDFEHGRQINKINLGKNTVCLDVSWHPVLYSTVGVSTWDGSIIILQ